MFSFNFYFADSNIMGSLADWFMVVVTAITAIFLILTFRSQQIVQRAQQHVTLIENERYRLDTLPVFDLYVTGANERLDWRDELYVFLKIKVTLIKNNAQNVSASFNCTGAKIEEPFDKPLLAEIVLSENYIHDFSLKIMTTREKLTKGDLILDIVISFEDLILNQYDQHFAYTFGFSSSTLTKDTYPTYLGRNSIG